MLGIHFWVRLLTLGRSQSAGNKVHKSFHIAHARAALEPENAAVGRQSLPGGQSGWRLFQFPWCEATKEYLLSKDKIAEFLTKDEQKKCKNKHNTTCCSMDVNYILRNT